MALDTQKIIENNRGTVLKTKLRHPQEAKKMMVPSERLKNLLKG